LTSIVLALQLLCGVQGMQISTWLIENSSRQIGLDSAISRVKIQKRNRALGFSFSL